MEMAKLNEFTNSKEVQSGSNAVAKQVVQTAIKDGVAPEDAMKSQELELKEKRLHEREEAMNKRDEEYVEAKYKWEEEKEDL